LREVDQTGLRMMHLPPSLHILARTAKCLAVSLTLAAFANGQQLSNSFGCESHTVTIDHFPGAKSAPAQAPDKRDSQALLEAEFSGFDPQYSVESVHFVVLFVRDGSKLDRTVGTLRILAFVRNRGTELVKELTDHDDLPFKSHGWYKDWHLPLLLRVELEPPQAAEDISPSDDPMVEHAGRPQVRLHQADPKKPVFLLKFIGLTPAGGWGEVEAESALVLDLRGGDLNAPAAVGCIKNDFAGQNHDDEWIHCTWRRNDYVCSTNAYYGRDWEFQLIAGRRLPAKHRISGR